MSLTDLELCEIQGLCFARREQAQAVMQQENANLSEIYAEFQRRKSLVLQQAQAQAAKETAEKVIGAPPIQQPPLPGELRRTTKKKR